MLGVLPSAQSHFTPSQGRGGDNTDPNADAVAAQKSIVNATPELTSGQHDADTSKLGT